MESTPLSLATLDDLTEEAGRLARSLVPNASHATLVTLSGELGAGKTTFVQAIARSLGVTDHVTSPTFVLAKAYDLTSQSFDRLIHIDAYRLTEQGGLRTIGFETYFAEPKNLMLLEWPEMVDEELPQSSVRIALEALEDGARRITYA